MKPHVILIADAGGEIGWGHAVRQLALAEALCERGVRTLAWLQSKDAVALPWPCPVSVGLAVPMDKGRVRVWDAPGQQVVCGPDDLAFDDYGTVTLEGEAPVVDPHFGAADRHTAKTPSFLGPRWAPLRSEFATRRLEPKNENRTGIFVYGDAPALPKDLEARRPHSMNAKSVAQTMAGSVLALVPPSMVALECLALGTPVVLHVPGPKWQPIADAMVAAGVAEIWTGAPDDYTLACVLADDGKRRRMAEAGREAVDGRGAMRLAEWLGDV